MIRLSKRLECALSLVPCGHAALDVGCDHAFTSIALVESGKCPFCVASDVRPGPLLAAENNIRQAGLEEKVRTVLADGVPRNIEVIFSELKDRELKDREIKDHGIKDREISDSETAGKRTEDVCESPEGNGTGFGFQPAACVITGMGGALITRILEEAGTRLDLFDALILSPQSEPDKVRGCLPELHFKIAQEKMVKEDGKYYTMILCVRGSGEPLSKKEALYGPVLLKKRDPILHEYLLKQRDVLSGIREELRLHGKDGGPRYTEVSELLEVTDEALEDY